jgi:tetratricopeptide (TPR) repeat protein
VRHPLKRVAEASAVNSSVAATSRYARTGAPEDLESARRTLAETLRRLPADSPSRSAVVITLALVLRDRGLVSGDPGPLQASAAMLEAFEPAHPQILANLALVLIDLHAATGVEDALSRAIEACERALVLPGDAMTRAFTAGTLGQAYIERGDDLDRGIAHLDQAARSDQLEPEATVAFRVALANALVRRYTADPRRHTDLNRAIDLDTETLQGLPQRSPEAAQLLQNLGTGLCDRWMAERNPDDLDRAQAAFAQARETPGLNADLRNTLVGGAGRVALHRFTSDRRPSDLGEAISLLEQVADRPRSGPSPDRTNLAIALGERFELSDDPADLERAVALLEAEIGRAEADDPRRPTWLGDLAGMLLESYSRTADAGALERAVAMLEQARDALPSDSPRRAPIATNLGPALMLRHAAFGDPADLDQAVAVLREALNVAGALPDEALRQRGNLAATLRQRSLGTGETTDLDEAIDTWRAAMASPSARPRERAGWLRGLAGALTDRYARTGDTVDLEAAVSYARGAIAAGQDVATERGLALSQLSVALADRYEGTHDAADLEEALATARDAIAQANFASAHTVGLHHNLGRALGLLYERTGHIEALQEATDASRQAFEATPEGSYGRGSFLNSFALRLIQLHRRTRQPGVLDEAVALLRRGLAGPGISWLERVGLHHNLGAALQERHRDHGSLDDLDRAIEAFEAAVDATPTGAADRVDMLGAVALARDARYEASYQIEDLRSAIAALEALWMQVSEVFSATPVAYKIAQQAEWSEVASLLVDRQLELAERAPEDATQARRRALVVAEGRKSRLLSEAMSRGDIPPPGDVAAGVLARERALLGQLAALDGVALAQTGRPHSPLQERERAARTEERSDVLRSLRELWDAIAATSTEGAHYVALRRASPPTWQELAALGDRLGPDTAVIAVHAGPARTRLFVLRAGADAPEVVSSDLSPSDWHDVLELLLNEIHRFDPFSPAEQTWDRPLSELAREAHALAGDTTQLVLAPDGVAHVVPWSVVLHRAGSGNTRRLWQIPALGLLRMLPRGSGSESPALVVGDPSEDLDHARDEALAVAGLLGGAALVGRDATREAVRSHLGHAGVVHLAMHARFDAESPLDSALVLADGETSARDVVAERLSADLVALSACETGLAGSLAGEELAGLAYAFLYAGARTLLVSLWPVDDPATASLMTAFYPAWRVGGDKAAALQTAMEQVRAIPERQHPYYWGAFVLLGAP